jgi:phage shock protein C
MTRSDRDFRREQRRFDREFADPRPRLADLRLADLRRSVSDRKFMGVCGGLAEWLGVAPLGVRLITVAGLFIVPPVTMIAYVLLSVLLDKDIPRGSKSSGFSPNAGFSPQDPPSARPGEALAALQRRFGFIEERLRKTEAEVTSTSFRINSELKKS